MALTCRVEEGPTHDAFFPKPYDAPAIIRQVKAYFE
jgi:hypothetical protein